MKKSKIVITILFVMVFLLAGCSVINKENNSSTTPASQLVKVFEENIKSEKDISLVADKIARSDVIKIKMVTEERVNEDYLAGFDDKIINFNKAFVIQPLVGSIPFIAYVFETSDVKLLEKELKKSANPRWNICTEADETIVKVVDNYIFFIMAPKSFEEYGD